MPPPITERYWFDAVAEFLGPAYLRNAFTKGTEQEVDFLVDALGLEPGMRVLDVGCGPGRHSLALARRGFEVVGVDHSAEFVRLARRPRPPTACRRDLRGARRARPRPSRRVRRRDLPLPGRVRPARRARRGRRVRPDRRHAPARRCARGQRVLGRLRPAPPRGGRGLRPGHRRAARGRHGAWPDGDRSARSTSGPPASPPASSSSSPAAPDSTSIEVHGVTPGAYGRSRRRSTTTSSCSSLTPGPHATFRKCERDL